MVSGPQAPHLINIVLAAQACQFLLIFDHRSIQKQNLQIQAQPGVAIIHIVSNASYMVRSLVSPIEFTWI